MSDDVKRQGRNVLVFADGTGDEGGLLPDENCSNVYKLFRATRVDAESSVDPERQIAFYIPGIGTPMPGVSLSWSKRFKEGIAEGVGGGLTTESCSVMLASSAFGGQEIGFICLASAGARTRSDALLMSLSRWVSRQNSRTDRISAWIASDLPIANSGARTLYWLGLTTKLRQTRP